MGEQVDMILEGTLCEGCGGYIGRDWGPQRCKDCEEPAPPKPTPPPQIKKPRCKICGKKVKPTGMKDHLRDAHPPKPTGVTIEFDKNECMIGGEVFVACPFSDDGKCALLGEDVDGERSQECIDKFGHAVELRKITNDQD